MSIPTAKPLDATSTIGTLLDNSQAIDQRDAIHVAVMSVVACHTLRPGDHVGFQADGTVGISGEPIGIVDPFLTSFLNRGDRFWLAIYPRQITSLRHVWSHPRIADEMGGGAGVNSAKSAERIASEAWIKNYAVGCGVGDEELMNTARNYVKSPAADGGYDRIVGRDNRRGNPVREITVERQDYEWQTTRYDSGGCSYTNEHMSLEHWVKFGDWTLAK